MSSAIGDKHELLAKAWDAQSIAKLLIDAENMPRLDSLRNQKLNAYFRAKLDQSLAVIRKKWSIFHHQ